MAKLFGITGLVVGKLGGAVYAVRNGVQIARVYNPSPAQPKTEKQVEAQAKLKLLSQLAASIAPVIAIARKGIVSGRNQFTQRNYEFTSYGGNAASIPMGDILLTASNAGFPAFRVNRSSGEYIRVSLLENVSTMWDRVVYVVLKKTSSQQIMPATSLLVSDAGADGMFKADLPYVEGDISVHVYGIRLNTASSRVMFGNLIAPTAEEVAKLITSRTYNESDFSLSETRGVYMSSIENTAEPTGTSTVTIAANAIDVDTAQAAGGTITGQGVYAIGSSVTLTATPDEGYTFVGWRESGSTTIVSTSATYTFSVNGSRSLQAVFQSEVSAQHTINVARATGSDAATTSGAGQYAEGAQVTLNVSGFGGEWDGWYSDAAHTQRLSTERPYTFTMGNANRTIYYYIITNDE